MLKSPVSWQPITGTLLGCPTLMTLAIEVVWGSDAPGWVAMPLATQGSVSSELAGEVSCAPPIPLEILNAI